MCMENYCGTLSKSPSYGYFRCFALKTDMMDNWTSQSERSSKKTRVSSPESSFPPNAQGGYRRGGGGKKKENWNFG
jgi:hypothetical protein